MNWKHRVVLKHLLTKEEDYESVHRSMSAIADVLGQAPCFSKFKILGRFRKLPTATGRFTAAIMRTSFWTRCTTSPMPIKYGLNEKKKGLPSCWAV